MKSLTEIKEAVNTGMELAPTYKVIGIKTTAMSAVINAIGFNSVAKQATAVVIDLAKEKLSDAIRYDGVKNRFFLATDCRWLDFVNTCTKGVNLVFQNVDNMEHEDMYVLDRIISTFGSLSIKTPFSDGLRLILVHKKVLDLSSAATDNLFTGNI